MDIKTASIFVEDQSQAPKEYLNLYWILECRRGLSRRAR